MTKRVLFLLLIIMASCRGKDATEVQVIQVKRGTFMEELLNRVLFRQLIQFPSQLPLSHTVMVH
jgi:hypothetical protein